MVELLTITGKISLMLYCITIIERVNNVHIQQIYICTHGFHIVFQ